MTTRLREYVNQNVELDSPAAFAQAVTTSADFTPDKPCRALFIGSTGNLQVVTVGGSTALFTGIAAGTILPLRIVTIKTSLTTVNNMTAMW